MASRASLLFILASSAAVIPAVLAHGGEDGAMNMGEDPAIDDSEWPPTYFAHPEHRMLMYGHIISMVIGWVFVLPVAVVLSLARSRHTLLTQFVFLATNAVGVLLAAIYNGSTPDLYPNNAHHKLGWIVTFVVGVQVLIGLFRKVSRALSGSRSHGARHERAHFIPLSGDAMAEHERLDTSAHLYRLSNDSGQGTERNTESLRSNSLRSSSSSEDETSIPLRDVEKEYADEEDDHQHDLEAHFIRRMRLGRVNIAMRKVSGLLGSRAWTVLDFYYGFVDRTILILGFISICLGIIAYGRFFEGHQVFTGLAHWIKGGIFFWLGVLTLGRWAGCFGELGWAWNVRPKSSTKKWRPTAEFVESLLIFIYGSTNIFLEHLGSWGKAWSAQDLEHMSITVLFIGGGLMGMLIESTRVRELLNTTVTEAAHAHPDHAYDEEERAALRAPRQYEFSVNPIPALVILLLGIMMSSHQQSSMTSSMVHKQWGNLLTGASFARGFSYVLVYLKPPTSILPSRPPTELLASFGLISGGIIFMVSSGDTVDAMMHMELDAMFMYTVTMGLVGVLMSWILVVIAIKGWAVRKEAVRRHSDPESIAHAL